MEPHGFDVIDVHHHYEAGYSVGESLFGDRKGPGPGETKEAFELKTRLDIMAAQHVGKAIIIAGHTYLRPRGLPDTREANDDVARYRDARPDRFVGAVGVIEPLYGPAGHDEARRCREELGMVGISFHNGYQGVPTDSPLMRPLIEKIGEAGLVPFIHAFGHPLETLWQADALAADFPGLPMVVLDAFHDPYQVRSIPDVAARRPDLLFDLALCPSFDALGLPTVRAAGADRFVFGTDMYSWPLMTKPNGATLPEIVESDLSHDDKSAILSGNISRLFGF